MNYRAIGRAGEDIFNARLLLRKHGIFIPDDLRKKTEDTLEVLSTAQIERHMDLEGRGAPLNLDGINVLKRDGANIFDELMRATRDRMLREPADF